MSNSDWTRLWDAFHAALDVPAAERSGWLRGRVGDPGERAEIESLLAAHERGGAELDVALQREPELVGRRLGAWRLRHEIGRGGMGAVWLAERELAGFTQQAAIKFVAAPFAQPALIARFRREQQILASLQHPEIARLLDGGVAEDGLPWLAMEFVDGLPLERWCREQSPTLRERLQLMIRLCAAVQYAHQHLIVHRDLKPGNVLVVDGVRPVLLDFGIGKLLEQTGDPDRTGTAMPAPFTPRYASPEQLLGRPAGTASDVYSLGAVLYELLSGTPPFAAPGSSWGVWVAEVTERAPPPPSARGGRLAIDRELDAIVLMALRKEPERRYATASSLGDDLQRYLEHKPVRARPDATAYRLAKFVRRHRVGVAAGVLIVALLAGLGIRLGIESERARAALGVSQREREHAAETIAFLSEIFREADPTRGDGRPVSAHDVLERGVALLDARRFDAAGRIAVQIALGEIFVNAGDYTRAESLFDEALTQLASLDAAVALRGDALHGKGGAQQAGAHHAQAQATLTEALALRQASHGAGSLEVAATLDRLGAAEQALGHFDGAADAYRQVLAIRRAQLAPDDPRIADVLLRVGSLAWSRGDYDVADARYRDALALRRAHPEQAADLARVLDAIGALAHVRGRHAHAEASYREALQLRRAVLGDAHRLTADTLGNLGALAYDRGDPSAALPLLQQALDAQQAALGADSPVVAKTLNNLALAQAALGQREPARSNLERALAINIAAFGAQHLRVAGNLNNLGLVKLDAGDASAAADDFASALATMQAIVGDGDPQLGFALTNRARALGELGDDDGAAAAFARALALRRAHLDAGHPSLAETLTWYGTLRCERGAPVDGVAMLEEALALRRRVFGEAHASVAQSGALLAACRVAAGHVVARVQGRDYAMRVAADPASGEPLKRRVAPLLERN